MMPEHYLVFTGRKWENVMGKKGITWEIGGLFTADTPEDACLAAAQKLGAGTAFAIPGYPFGVDFLDAAKVTEVGVELDPIQRLERMGTRLAEQLSRALPAPQVRELEEGDNDTGR